MATIIDALVVTLGLDKKGFDKSKAEVSKGLDEIGKKGDDAGKKLDDAGKKTTDSFDKASKGLVKFLAVIGGTAMIKRFAMDLINADSAVQRFSQNIGESASTVSAWSNAVEIAGGSGEGLKSTMAGLSKAQTELKLTGQSALIPYFSALGVAIADVNGQARPVSELLLDLSDRFSHMNRSDAFNMGQAMGIDEGTMQLLLKGRAEVELMIRRQKEHGAVTKEQAEQAEKLRRMIAEGTVAFRSFGRELLNAAAPALEKFFKMLEEFGEWVKENQEFVMLFLGGLAAAFGALAIATLPIDATVVAILALAAAIALLVQDYNTWKRGGESLIDWTLWEKGINLAITGIKGIRDGIVGLVRTAALAGGALGALFRGDWDTAKALGGKLFGGTGEAPAASTGATTPIVAPPAVGIAAGPRGVRNNNPGNLNFAGQAGATLEGGSNARFAKFGSMQEGVAALVNQIGLYGKRGKNTIRQIVSTFAPSSENDTNAYIAAVSKQMGIGPDDTLDLNSAAQVQALVKAIVRQEGNASGVTDEQIAQGFAMSKLGGVRGASQFAGGAGAAQVASSRAPAAAAAGGGGDRTTSVETHIGEIKVYSAATDANGIAADMGNAIDYLFTSQANVGLS